MRSPLTMIVCAGVSLPVFTWSTWPARISVRCFGCLVSCARGELLNHSNRAVTPTIAAYGTARLWAHCDRYTEMTPKWFHLEVSSRNSAGRVILRRAFMHISNSSQVLHNMAKRLVHGDLVGRGAPPCSTQQHLADFRDMVVSNETGIACL